jgi:hypothetical protein
MRFPLALILACFALSAAAESQKISCPRVFPNGEQIGLFIAAADGRDEAMQHVELDLVQCAECREGYEARRKLLLEPPADDAGKTA